MSTTIKQLLPDEPVTPAHYRAAGLTLDRDPQLVRDYFAKPGQGKVCNCDHCIEARNKVGPA